MALPHLVIKGRSNPNFKNSYEANFVTQSRLQNDKMDFYEQLVQQQRRHEHVNSSYDKMISDSTYEKSLTNYIALREKARKANELVSRRAHLSDILRAEQEVHLIQLRDKSTPQCNNLYESIREKGFFETLYECESDAAVKTRIIPRHLISEYEQELYGYSEDPLAKMKYKNMKKLELRSALIRQQDETKSRMSSELQKDKEWELLMLKSVHMEDEKYSSRINEQNQKRKNAAKEDLISTEMVHRNRLILEAVTNDAMQEEALHAESLNAELKAMEETKRQDLLLQTRTAQKEQILRNDEKRRSAATRRNDETLAMVRSKQLQIAEEKAEMKKNSETVKMTKAFLDNQVTLKYKEIEIEASRQRQELDNDKKAEYAYQALIKSEADNLKLRGYSNYRYKLDKS